MHNALLTSQIEQPQYTACPLSHGQQALWFLYEMAPQSIAYNIFITVKICSKLDLAAFHQTWQRIVARHPILRTTYTAQLGKPIQKIYEHGEVDLQIVEAKDWGEEELKKQIYKETDRLFNLETDSVLRVRLFTHEVEEHTLLLTMHHIAGDMWSFDLLINEFQDFYTAEIEKTEIDREEPLEDLAYTKFIDWQSELLDSDRGQQQWEYWHKQLAGELPVLDLLIDRHRSISQSNCGAAHLLKLDEDLIIKLKAHALDSGTSLYKLMLTAFYVLLYRYTGQEDILVGVPMLGRQGEAFKKGIGYFVTSTVLRVDISGDDTFRALLDRVSNRVNEAQKHQDYPFSLLVERIQPQRDLDRSPLFQTSFTLQKQRWYQHEQDLHQTIKPYLLGHQRGVTSDLDVAVMEAGELLQICWQYNTDLFEADTIAQMSAHFQMLLQGIVANPQQRISDLSLLTEQEYHQLLVEWNQTQTNYPQDKCIHHLFEEQVKRNPDAIAVVFENQQLTYRELNTKANQLAHYLRDLEVKTETLMGICVERSLEMIIGVLGILKAGGAYVPLDPAYPQKRLSFMVEDADISIILTKSQLIDRLPIHRSRLVYLDKEWQEIAQQSGENPTQSVKSDNLAYVIYTSGSTGKPKGVLIEHKSLVNYTSAVNTEYAISNSDRILQFASLNFDIAAEEIYTCLTSGAALILRNELMLDSPQIFLQKCQEWGISVVNLPTAYWHELVALLAVGKLTIPSSWRLVAIGGEQALRTRLTEWHQYVDKQVRLVNSYGPTEATINTSIYDLAEDVEQVLIGRPIANTSCFILDKHFQPVPIGVAGELYIGGDGLARGYLNRPDLTAQKFISNPFSDEPNSRLYKTGDLARYLPDGNIEFLGRIDHQVKIRGFRIELGEIESALTQHPDVREAIVIVREDKPNDKRLVAYLSGNLTSDSIPAMRTHLKGKLPDYMMPSAIVLLDTMPLTPNGKIDRRALPAPDRTGAESANSSIAPSTPTETVVALIWTKVLNLQQVGIHDNFFELGGHSLLAVQIISRISEKFEIDLPLSYLFQSPTIAALSQSIDSALITNTQSHSYSNILAVLPRSRNQVIPLSFAQYDLWYEEQKYGGKCAGNSPLTLKLTGIVSPTVLEQSLNEIIRRHEILRTTFPIVEGQPNQKIAPSLILPFQFIDLEHLCSQTSKEDEAQKISREAMNHEFDLTVAPPIKIMLIRLSESEHWLLILMHHLITDGWSYGILLQELETIYSAFLADKPSPLPELPFQYADFAIWQRNYFSEEVLAAHLPYWQQHLANLPTSLDLLPAIESTPDNRSAADFHLTLPTDLTNSLSSFSQVYNATPFTILTTALNILLHKWSNQTDILVVGTMANRSTPEIEQLLGCFINDVPLYAQLNGDQTAISLLEQVKQTVSDTLTHLIPPSKIWQPFKDQSKVLRTVNLILVPSNQYSSQTLNYEELTIATDRGLWNDRYFPLELYVSYPIETDRAIELDAYYSTSTFTTETIECFLQSYQVILDQLVRHPETIISKFVLNK
jgi:amino acid adenylation domain-containing protein